MVCVSANEAVPALAELVTVNVQLKGVPTTAVPPTSLVFVTLKSGASGTVLLSVFDVTVVVNVVSV